MSPSSDESRFTAWVLGESPPEDQAVFEQALEQDPALRCEAGALHRTAGLLATALKQEPPVMMTTAQRHAVLEPRRAVSLTTKAGRPAWWMPTLATAGIAAAVAIGAFVLPASPKAVTPAVSASGIPAVGIQPTSPAKPGHKPVLPPPAVATGSGLPVAIPDASSPPSPALLPPSGTMAAVPPVLEIPAASPAAKEPPLRPPVPPVRSAPGNLAPGEALGSGPPR
jgi:hypothetical protein